MAIHRITQSVIRQAESGGRGRVADDLEDGARLVEHVRAAERMLTQWPEHAEGHLQW